MEFHFLQTDDGSPSLKLGLTTESASAAEAMHSSKGAFAETVYIYGHAISIALANNFRPTFLSLGLGLGYNELLTSALLLKNKTDLSEVYGESFELVPELTHNFLNWLSGDLANAQFKAAYDQICSLCAAHTGQEQNEIRSTLRILIKTNHWNFNGPLTSATKLTQKFSCFMFDAFSSKTSPELWDEEFITEFLSASAADNAVLSTYACTGSLKRALAKNKFDVEIRDGFAGKRESTFAIRKGLK